LCEFCASLVIKQRDYDIFIAFADKIEPAFQGNSIMARCQSAVRSVCHTGPDLPVGDELRDGALPSPGLLVKIPVPVPAGRKGTERAGDEECAEVDSG